MRPKSFAKLKAEGHRKPLKRLGWPAYFPGHPTGLKPRCQCHSANERAARKRRPTGLISLGQLLVLLKRKNCWRSPGTTTLVPMKVKLPLALSTLVATGTHWLTGRVRLVLSRR